MMRGATLFPSGAIVPLILPPFVRAKARTLHHGSGLSDTTEAVPFQSPTGCFIVMLQ
jgi:hypothetical protein